ncbi:MAG: cyclic nucleotide-binding domain-containing protein [Rubrivivax sp.]|nr:cyclic nucleotide-binding domain-containing protein [Rubrivivax sp.]
MIATKAPTAPLQRAPVGLTVGELLRDTEWMRPVPDPVRDHVIGQARETFHAPGEMVERRGDRVESWIGLDEGLPKVSATSATGRGMMSTGEPERCGVGDESLMKNAPRQYDLVALRASRTIHIPRPTFEGLLEVSLEFNRFITRHLNERAGQFMGALEKSRIANPTARLAGAICGLFNPVLYPGASQHLPFFSR